ncbi:MAG: hypothetical protein QOF36_2567 [Microbacteriaceae bacterium]|nr:hypothetical protein [Microbacteriaceae bacterium]
MSTLRKQRGMAPSTFPTKAETWAALKLVGRVLDREVCYLVGSTHHYCLGEEGTISLTPDSGHRFRVERWRDGKVTCTLWALTEDPARLADVALALSGVEVAA